MNDHEEQFARLFILPEKCDRYLTLFQSKRGRKKLRAGLCHSGDIDNRFARQVPAADQNAESVERILKSKGASDNCYLFSAESAFDEREMKLLDALQEVVGSGSGTFVSCIPGKLGYFEFEDTKERCVLER